MNDYPDLTPEHIRHDFPIMGELNRHEMLLTTGAIAFYLADKVSLLPTDWSELGIPHEAQLAVEQLSEEQLQMGLLYFLAALLRQTPIPCECCGATGTRQPENGLCGRCDRLFNAAAVYQIGGSNGRS